MAEKPLVSVIMGSDSDYPVMKKCVETLETFGVPSEVKVLSAHRSPEKVREFSSAAEDRGVKVIIAAAGGAAHLAGVIAAHTTLPVLGVPMPSKLDGMDSLLSTVQMPSGVPVATFSIGNAGAANSAIFAVQIIASADEGLKSKMKQHKERLASSVEQKNKNIQDQR